MYYSSGNYEAFATPKKPEGVDHKSAYIIGSGLAALTAACYLVRDGQMKGEHVHVFATLLCQRPKLAPHIPAMRRNLANAFGLPVDAVSVKATTEEHLGFTGEGLGIAAHAVALIETL